MSHIITLTGKTTTHDESAGLQNATETPTPSGDKDDNDIVVASLPSVFSEWLTDLGADPSGAIGAALSGYDGTNIDEDEELNVLTVDATGTISNLAFVDANGDPLDGLDSGLTTVDGNTIFLYTDADNDNIVLGREGDGTGTADPDGNIVLAVYLEANADNTAAKIWTVQYEPTISHPDTDDPDDAVNLDDKLFVAATQDLEFDASNAPSGQNLFIMFGDGNITDGDAEVGVVATGKNPINQSDDPSAITSGDTINTSQAGGPTTFGVDNQMLNEGEGIYFTFVSGPDPEYTVPDLTPGEADVEANIQFTALQDSRGASFDVVQLQAGKTAVVTLTAYANSDLDPSGENFVDAFANDTPVDITSVDVFDFDGGGEVDITDNLNGTFTISGIEAGDTINYFTDGDHNRILIENDGDGRGKDSADFDIGGFTLIEVTQETAEVGDKVFFEDDGPTVDLTLGAGILQTDDGDLAGGNSGDGTGTDTDSAGVNDLFTVTESDGADGDGGTVYSLVLGTNTTTTLLDAATNETVVLSLNAGVVEGRTDTSNDLVFTLSVDSETGAVTLEQSRAVEHATTDTAAPYNGDITGLGVIDAVNLSATITDGDDDTATDSIDISGTLQFTDDGPTIDLTLAENALLQTDDGDLTNGNSGDGTGTDTDSAGVNDLFTVTESDGADGDGGTVYSLVLGTNTTTTLLDAATNETVVLSLNAGVVEGRTDTSNDLVFTLSVDSETGAVTLEQSRAVEHATTDTAAPYNGDTTGLGVIDAVNLSATITDGDDDTATDSIDISGTLQFTDDGPTIDLTLAENALLQTDDGDLTDGNSGDGTGTDTDSAGVNDLFTVTESDGADGDGGTVYSLVLGTNTTTTLLDAATNETVVLSLNAGVVEGRTDTSNDLVFTLSVDSETGAVTLEQSRAVEHATTDTAAPYNGDITGLGVIDAVNLSATITDGDDDTATDSIDISGTLQFTDDGPTIDLTLAENALLQTDDGDLTNGNSGDGTGTDTDSAGVNDLFTVTESDGADGDGGTVYSLVLGTNTTTTLLDAATNETVVLSLNAGVVEGRTDTSNDLVFTLSVDSETGAVTLEQSRAVEHATTDTAAPYNGDITGLGVIDAVNLSATITDGDDDTATDSIDISGTLQFTDDGPTIDLTLAENALLQTDDGDLTGGNSGDGTGTDTDSAGVNDLFTVTESDGADGDGGTVYSLVLGTNTTTTLLDAATNETVVLSLNAGVVEGRTDTSNDLVFTLSVDSETGAVTLEQSRAVEHATTDTAAPYNGDITGLGVIDAVNLSATITDGDDDTATDSIDISGTLQFTDDGPTIDLTLAENALLQTDDGDLTDGNSGDGTGTDTDSAGVNDLFTVTESDGADGDGGTVYSLVLGTNTTTTLLDAATNETVVLSLNAGVVEGRTDTSNDLVFTLSVDSETGAVTLEQSRAVEHATTDTAAPYNGDITGLGVIDAVNLSATITDGDDDTATDSIDISGTLQFTDDGPDVDFSNLVGTVTTTPQIGFWDEITGADRPVALAITASPTFDMVTADGDASIGTVSDFVYDTTEEMWIGLLTADFDNDPGNGDETIGFSLTVNEDGTYEFVLDEVALPVVTLSTDEGQLPAGGPDPVQTLSFLDGPDFVFFAVDAGTATSDPSDIGMAIPLTIPPAAESPDSPIGLGELDLTEAELQALSAMVNIEGTGVNGTDDFPFIRDEIEMNVSTSGIGVGNNVLQGQDLPGDDPGTINPFDSGAFDESFVINPEPLASSVKVYISKTAGGFAPPDSGATAAKTDYLYYNVYDELGNNSGPILVDFADVLDEADVAAGGTGENLWSFTVDAGSVPGDSIDAVQFTMGFGAIKIPKIEVVVSGDAPPNDIFLDFSATLTDADGDSATTAFAVDLVGNDIISDEEMFDYTLVDAGPGPDAFDVDVLVAGNYLVQGFDPDPGDDELYDQLYLLNGSTYELNTGDFGAGDSGTDDSQILLAEGAEIIVEDATLSDINITIA